MHMYEICTGKTIQVKNIACNEYNSAHGIKNSHKQEICSLQSHNLEIGTFPT